ncbi:hypothetical protein D0T49_02995 [Paludibacter sp. 221]|uniref:hypothetical protein n=1 Tax=Paludibacter sp. 221 TaxID=2302939 RepID=UPI0013D0777D|nr:hypothetical protein [Paludibacter sp. 221]NDV46006.1 hypothetical protein [Paludibacter sp. 221]
MKKTLFLLAVIALTFSSCILEGPQGPKGDPGRDGASVVSIDDYMVTNYNSRYVWRFNDDVGVYYCELPAPRLTGDVYNNGVVHIYIEMEDNVGNLYQQPLPKILYNLDNNGNQYSENIDFEYTVGKIIMYYTVSDYYYEDWQPGTMNFRVVLMK